MKFEQYKEQVKRTLPNLPEINGNPLILDSIHMVLGMCSEIYELHEALEKADKVNVAEELTDIAWYASNYCNLRDIIPVVNLEFIKENETGTHSMVLFRNELERAINAISELQDYDKKELAYKKEDTDFITVRRRRCISLIINSLNSCYFYYNINPEQAMQNNIDKLRARFPDKFDEDKANNRDLQLERKELEK